MQLLNQQEGKQSLHYVHISEKFTKSPTQGFKGIGCFGIASAKRPDIHFFMIL
jgi:hypothetical protein